MAETEYVNAGSVRTEAMPEGLRYSERMLWDAADEQTRVLLGRIARLRSGLVDEWQEVAREAQARAGRLASTIRVLEDVIQFMRDTAHDDERSERGTVALQYIHEALKGSENTDG